MIFTVFDPSPLTQWITAVFSIKSKIEKNQLLKLTFSFAVSTAGSFVFAVLIYWYSIHVTFHMTTFALYSSVHVHLSHKVSDTCMMLQLTD